jgi:hypothetical protein
MSRLDVFTNVLMQYRPKFGPDLPVLYTRVWHYRLALGVLTLWLANGLILSFQTRKLARLQIDPSKLRSVAVH